jgi:hypothetical protein
MRRLAHTTWRGAPAKVVREAAAGFGGAIRLRAQNTAYPQILEHLRPALGHSGAGRQRQPLAPPRGVRNAVGGPVVEPQLGELGVAQGAGDEVARGRDRDFVVIL